MSVVRVPSIPLPVQSITFEVVPWGRVSALLASVVDAEVEALATSGTATPVAISYRGCLCGGALIRLRGNALEVLAVAGEARERLLPEIIATFTALARQMGCDAIVLATRRAGLCRALLRDPAWTADLYRRL